MEESTYHVTYIVIETIRASCEYYAFNTTSGIVPPLTLFLSNSFKLATAAVCLFCSSEERSSLLDWSSKAKDVKYLLPFAIPIALDLLSTLTYVIASKSTTPFLLQAFMVLHVPTTAVLHHIWIQKLGNPFAWGSLIWLCLGLLISKLPRTEALGFREWSTAIAAGSVIGLFSALSSIWSEKLLKSGSFWKSQFWLCAWGTLLSACSYPLVTGLSAWGEIHADESKPKDVFWTHLGSSILLAVLTAGVGFVVAVILRRTDNLVRLVGATTSLLISMVMLNCASSVLQEARATNWSTVGYFILAISLWLYDYHKNIHRKVYDAPQTDRYQACEHHSLISLPEDVESTRSQSLEEPTHVLELGIVHTHDSERTFLEQHDNRGSCSPLRQRSPDIQSWNGTFSVLNSFWTSSATICNAMTFGLVPLSAPPTVQGVKSGILSVAIFLLPSFIPIAKGKSAEPTKRTHPTAYLDGIRGIAALNVVTFHGIGGWLKNTLYGWNGTTQKYFIQLPWIRLVISGNAMVAVFFVVSGFSISYSPLKYSHTNNVDGFATSIASSVLRRHMRLFLPCAVLTFGLMLLVHFGAERGLLNVPIAPFPTQIQHWWIDLLALMNPVRDIKLGDILNTASAFAGNLWTIPLEFRGSMVVYVLLVGCSRLPSKARMLLISGIAFALGYYMYWDLVLFLSGLVLADMRLSRSESATLSGFFRGIFILTKDETEHRVVTKTAGMALAENAFWIVNFIIATFILSMPTQVPYPPGGGDPGYQFLWSLTPTRYVNSRQWSRFWPMIGAIYLVFTIDNCKLLQAIFTSRFPTYLGFISFALYLVHLPLMTTYGTLLLRKSWRFTGIDTDTGFLLGFWAAYPLILLGCLWVADIYTRGVDVPCVKLSKWIYGKMIDSGKGGDVEG